MIAANGKIITTQLRPTFCNHKFSEGGHAISGRPSRARPALGSIVIGANAT
jgi:hypothetical protein